MTQKGSTLFGAALTEEVLDSSDSILSSHRGVGIKGLQQFYSPPELADLVYEVMGKDRVVVLDPTAGNGSLLKRFPPAHSFGVEIDADQINAAEGSYKSVMGDIKEAFPLIYKVAPEFDAVVANPPFGLRDWADETVNNGKPVGSVVLTFHYAIRALRHNGQFAFVCGRDQLDREILPLPDAKGIYFIVECDDLFDGTEHPCAIAFGVHPDSDRFEFEVIRKKVPRTMLDLLPTPIINARQKVAGTYFRPATTHFGAGRTMADAWEAIDKEYRRRIDKKLAARVKSEYDVELVGGKVLNVSPSPFVQLVLAKKNVHRHVNRLHGYPITYFSNYERDWTMLTELLEEGVLGISPKVIEAVEALLHDNRRVVCPLYPIKETMRLGYLTDVTSIKCKLDDPERRFVKGESYSVDGRTHTITQRVKRYELVKRGENIGEMQERTYEQQRQVLRITINGRHHFYDTALADEENADDIRYIIEHFELPDPGDVGTRYPEETQANRDLLREIERETIIPCSKAYFEKHKDPRKPPVSYKKFQVEDIARLLVKKDGMLAWEQGLGKTLGALSYINAAWKKGAKPLALIITPQDLIPQWISEAERFLGITPTVVKTHAEANELRRKAKRGKAEGIFVTYYEALAVNGTRRSEMLPEITVREQRTEVLKEDTGTWAVKTDPETGEIIRNANGYAEREWVPAEYEERIKKITSKHICPQCEADRKSGWNGKSCRAELDDGSQCSYSHYKHRVKPMGSMLSTAFRKGVVVVDEGTKIQGDYSAQSEVIRGIRGGWKLLMSGTPIKNYIPQAFWPLWWCLGNASKRFPYPYEGKGQFENNHAVIEWLMTQSKKGTRKVLPEVTNLSQLWRLLASSIIRRRKEETGEELVPLTYHPITTPLGVAQREQIAKWTKDFHHFFIERNPGHPVVKAGAAEVMAPMLGMQQKLDYGATCPESDPDAGWTGVEGVTNYTPANLRSLEVTMALAKQDRKIVLGSMWKHEVAWLADRLVEKGVRAQSILNENGDTIPPAKRAQVVHAFQASDLQVLVTGIQAIRLGHNIDAASAAVVNGMPWDWESFDQFIARVHRMTSRKPVDVYLIIPGSKNNRGEYQTITGRKWAILRKKGDAASLALDGRLIEKSEVIVDEGEVIRQMVEAGLPAIGNEVLEQQVESYWFGLPQLSHYTPPEGILTSEEAIEGAKAAQVTFDLPEQPPVEEPENEELLAAEAVGEFLQALAPPKVEPTWLVAFGRDQDEIEAYLYDGNTIETIQPFNGNRSIATILCRRDAQYQSDRLASGLMGGQQYESTEAALTAAHELVEQLPPTTDPAPVRTTDLDPAEPVEREAVPEGNDGDTGAGLSTGVEVDEPLAVDTETPGPASAPVEVVLTPHEPLDPELGDHTNGEIDDLADLVEQIDDLGITEEEIHEALTEPEENEANATKSTALVPETDSPETDYSVGGHEQFETPTAVINTNPTSELELIHWLGKNRPAAWAEVAGKPWAEVVARAQQEFIANAFGQEIAA